MKRSDSWSRILHCGTACQAVISLVLENVIPRTSSELNSFAGKDCELSWSTGAPRLRIWECGLRNSQVFFELRLCIFNPKSEISNPKCDDSSIFPFPLFISVRVMRDILTLTHRNCKVKSRNQTAWGNSSECYRDPTSTKPKAVIDNSFCLYCLSVADPSFAEWERLNRNNHKTDPSGVSSTQLYLPRSQWSAG